MGPVGRDRIRTAAGRLAGRIRRTPTIEVGSDLFTHSNVVCKLELLQHTGSFKPRGAMNRALIETIPEAGLTAASGGNHGLAVAWVAMEMGVPAEIFVPEVSPATKVDALRGLGATVHVVGALYDDALAACRARQVETGALDIHAYDHLDTIAGAGTVATELEEQVGGADVVLVALGGGGLSAGIAAWFAGTDVRVITVEPENSPCFARAHAAGEPVEVEVSGRAADSLGAKQVGEHNWQVLTNAGATPVTVSDQSIANAQHRFWTDMRLVVEPGGAAAAAALMSGAFVPASDQRVAVIVCGANADPAAIAAGR